MVRLGLVAVVVLLAGCGGSRAAWPTCLHDNRPILVETAKTRGLRQVDPRFEAERAAAVSYPHRVEATVVRSRTLLGARRVERALAVLSFGVHPPLLPATSRPAAVERRGTVVLQWFGKRDHAREQALLDCAAS